MGKKYLAAFLAAALMLNNAMTGFAAVGIAGNGKGTLANAGDAFGNRTQETKRRIPTRRSRNMKLHIPFFRKNWKIWQRLTGRIM